MTTVDPDDRALARKQYARRYREANREQAREESRLWREANPERLREQAEQKRQWRKANPEEARRRAAASAARRKAADPERFSALQRTATTGYRERNPKKHAEMTKAAARRHYEANREEVNERSRRWAAANREVIREAQREWAARNPDKIEQKWRQRRARKQVVPSEPWTRLEILDRDGWTCMISDCRCPDGRFIDPALKTPARWSGSVDHIMPIRQGGPDLKSNLQAAHLTCNCTKGDAWDEEAS